MPEPLPGGIPDLGALGRPQQLQVAAAVLARHAVGLPAELVDATTLVEMFRQVVREELERIMLVSASDGAIDGE